MVRIQQLPGPVALEPSGMLPIENSISKIHLSIFKIFEFLLAITWKDCLVIEKVNIVFGSTINIESVLYGQMLVRTKLK